jgi:hypothetical protein
VLLEFYDYPAEHWVHLRTTNPIESTFATVRLRQRVTKGPGSRAAGIAMAFKLIESAQRRWRAVNAPHLVALVRAGATFERGKLVERTPTTSSSWASSSGRRTRASSSSTSTTSTSGERPGCPRGPQRAHWYVPVRTTVEGV